jgi:DNA-binding CsgD family transcriptional regulator
LSVAPVELAVDALVRSQQEALDRAQAFSRELAQRAARSGEVHRPEQLVSVVVGREAMGSISQQLQRSAREEVLTLDRPPYLAPHSELGVGVDPEQQVRMAAGVKYRTVFDQSLLDDAGIVARIRRDMAAGEEGRVLADLPLKLMVVDRTLALLPLLSGSGDDQPAALLIRPSVLVDSLVALFEALWRAAPPLRLDGGAVAEDEEEREARTVVGLLAAGLGDARIAHTLGVSERTVRRKVATALTLLGAETRFQAGLRAKERGWV